MREARARAVECRAGALCLRGLSRSSRTAAHGRRLHENTREAMRRGTGPRDHAAYGLRPARRGAHELAHRRPPRLLQSWRASDIDRDDVQPLRAGSGLGKTSDLPSKSQARRSVAGTFPRSCAMPVSSPCYSRTSFPMLSSFVTVERPRLRSTLEAKKLLGRSGSATTGSDCVPRIPSGSSRSSGSCTQETNSQELELASPRASGS